MVSHFRGLIIFPAASQLGKYYMLGHHIVVQHELKEQCAQRLVSHPQRGGGDELVNRSYRDRAADDLGHRDVTRKLSPGTLNQGVTHR